MVGAKSGTILADCNQKEVRAEVPTIPDACAGDTTIPGVLQDDYKMGPDTDAQDIQGHFKIKRPNGQRTFPSSLRDSRAQIPLLKVAMSTPKDWYWNGQDRLSSDISASLAKIPPRFL